MNVCPDCLRNRFENTAKPRRLKLCNVCGEVKQCANIPSFALRPQPGQRRSVVYAGAIDYERQRLRYR